MSINETLLHTLYSRILSSKNPKELREQNKVAVEPSMLSEYTYNIKDLSRQGYILIHLNQVQLTNKGIEKIIYLRELRSMEIDPRFSIQI